MSSIIKIEISNVCDLFARDIHTIVWFTDLTRARTTHTLPFAKLTLFIDQEEKERERETILFFSSSFHIFKIIKSKCLSCALFYLRFFDWCVFFFQNERQRFQLLEWQRTKMTNKFARENIDHAGTHTPMQSQMCKWMFKSSNKLRFDSDSIQCELTVRLRSRQHAQECM